MFALGRVPFALLLLCSGFRNKHVSLSNLHPLCFPAHSRIDSSIGKWFHTSRKNLFLAWLSRGLLPLGISARWHLRYRWSVTDIGCDGETGCVLPDDREGKTRDNCAWWPLKIPWKSERIVVNWIESRHRMYSMISTNFWENLQVDNQKVRNLADWLTGLNC